MTEANPERNVQPETELIRLKEIVRDYLELADAKFLDEELAHDDDRLGYIYGRLIEIGEDPDEVLTTYGVTEG